MKAEKEVEQRCEKTKYIQSTDKPCEWSPALHNASNDVDECSWVLWLRLLLTTLICLLYGIELNFVTICNLIQLLFVINFLCYHHHRSGCLRAVNLPAAVSFQLEFHLPHRFLSSKVQTRVSCYQHIQSTHRDCFIRVLLHMYCLAGKIKSWAWGLHLLHSDFRLKRCCKKGGFWCCSRVCYNNCGLFIRIRPTFSWYFLQNCPTNRGWFLSLIDDDDVHNAPTTFNDTYSAHNFRSPYSLDFLLLLLLLL